MTYVCNKYNTQTGISFIFVRHVLLSKCQAVGTGASLLRGKTVKE